MLVKGSTDVDYTYKDVSNNNMTTARCERGWSVIVVITFEHLYTRRQQVTCVFKLIYVYGMYINCELYVLCLKLYLLYNAKKQIAIA